jgi:hypothetical protein
LQESKQFSVVTLVTFSLRTSNITGLGSYPSMRVTLRSGRSVATACKMSLSQLPNPHPTASHWMEL